MNLFFLISFFFILFDKFPKKIFLVGGNINKNPGLAMCQNTEDTIPDMDKVEYCSNLDGEKCEYKIKGQKNLVTSKDQIIQNE